MSMAEVIKSIEREALREAQSHEIGGRNGEPIETSELHDMTIGIDGIKMHIVQARDVIDNYNVLLQKTNPICFDAMPTF